MELFLFFSLFWSVFKLFSYLFIGGKGDQSHPTFDLCPQTPRIFKESYIVPEKEIKLYIDIGVLLF